MRRIVPGILTGAMATSTVEDYLKCIFHEQERAPGALVGTGQIASALDLAPASVTAMVKTLADSGLVRYEPYAGVALTPAGEQLATHVLRRHRLIEQFLVQIVGMDWTEVHGEAEILEHAVSERLIERMDEMLGRPSVDPHGDPIPAAGGRLDRVPRGSLLSCGLLAPVRIARVTDQTPEFLRLLEKHGMMPGRRLTVRARDAVADTVEIVPEEGAPLRLGQRAASKILVEPAEA
jgi:DtxR family Mn-dependent transcriptional regulator